MKTLKRTLAVLLTLLLVSSSIVCFAADNSEKQYHEYKTSVLLGDSLCSGFRDYDYIMTEFTYCEDSYAAYLAKDLGIEDYRPMACPGFRTIEMRTMLEDDYVSNDPYLFEAVPHHSAEEILAKKDEFRKAVADADLITIQIGGNDWGAYLGWVMEDFIEANPLPEEFKAEILAYLESVNIVDGTVIKTIVELAQTFNAFDEFMAIMPAAIEYAFSELHQNWPIIVEDIYELNPDVTLVAVGMFNTTLSTPEGEPENVAEPDELAVMVEQMIIDYGNMPMINNQEKYGYIYVDTTGTIVETAHPTPAGHRHIADRILEELPDARFDLTDIKAGQKDYKAVEYMYVNGLINGTADKTFNGNAAMTKADFSALMSNYNTVYPASTSTKAVTLMEVKLAAFVTAEKKTINDVFNLLSYFAKIFFTNDAFAPATRTQVATEFYNYVK